MEIKDVNLGEVIMNLIEEKGVSKAKLAKHIGKDPQNMNRDVFNQKSLDTRIVRQISEFLDYNLFELYSSNNQNDYRRGSVKATVKIEMGEQQQEKTFTFLFGENKVEIK